MKILHSADWHINLHRKKVPSEWSANRFRLFFDKLHELESSHDIHIISGDVFDRKPEPDEICLFLRYANAVRIPTYIIPGNHEATKKGESFLEHFHEDYAITNPNLVLITRNRRETIMGQNFYFFPYGELQREALLPALGDEILVAHIRGEVPPHITPEYDFEKLRAWKLILLGDIHFAHRYMDYPAWYSGSPMNTSFDRDDGRDYGVNSIDLRSIDDYSVSFVPLTLPKLIRKTLKAGDQMKQDSFNHVIYEVTGSLDQLANIKNSELLDKKIAIKPAENSKLDLKNLSLTEELKAYLEYIKVSNTEEIVKDFQGLNINVGA
jgi:DNA repair exonuclease SbcCD nuclease subunit